MTREDPWEFEHSHTRTSRHERDWIEYEVEENHRKDIPTKVIVCPQCHGSGASSLYLGSYSSEELWEDPEFAEDYMRGGYDRTCESCEGRNVVTIIDEHNLAYDPELYRSYVEWMKDSYDCDAVSRQERMMGA